MFCTSSRDSGHLAFNEVESEFAVRSSSDISVRASDSRTREAAVGCGDSTVVDDEAEALDVFASTVAIKQGADSFSEGDFSFIEAVSDERDNLLVRSTVDSFFNARNDYALLISFDVEGQGASIIGCRSVEGIETIERTTSRRVRNTDWELHIDTTPSFDVGHHTSGEDVRVVYEVHNNRHNLVIGNRSDSFTKYHCDFPFLILILKSPPAAGEAF